MLAGPRSTVKRARTLRRQMSWPEVMLWQRLRQRPGGLKFRRQHPAGPYVLDFYCSAVKKVAIEVDGASHDADDRAEHDAERSAWLAANGVETIRVTAGEVSRNPDSAADSIVAFCMAR